MIDQMTRMQIASEIKRNMKEANELYNEKWVSAKALSAQFSMFTADWLKRYGHLLPRTQAIVREGNDEHCSGWSYPLHTIARMVKDGDIKNLILT